MSQSGPALDVQASMSGIQLGLARITTLLRALRSPHLATPVVHIAGTNGKGSVSAYLSSILSASNLRVGRFNSPHLVDEWDCVQVAGKTIDRRTFETVRQDVQAVDAREQIGSTSFELLVATAFAIFARMRPELDLAVIEVGMGGLTDATNVVSSDKTLLSIITSIDLDHQKFLGDNVADIARVKAGIVKRGNDVVLAKQAHPEVVDVLRSVVAETRSTLWQAGEAELAADEEWKENGSPHRSRVRIPLDAVADHPGATSSTRHSPRYITATLPLFGSYQLCNAATAVFAADKLRNLPRSLAAVPSLGSITDDAIVQGVESTRWPGRLSWLELPVDTVDQVADRRSPKDSSTRQSRPRVVRLLVDGAHNPSSSSVLADYIASLPAELRPTTLITALSSPRTPESILDPILRPAAASLPSSPSIREVIATRFSKPAGMEWVQPLDPRSIESYVQSLTAAAATISTTDAPTTSSSTYAIRTEASKIKAHTAQSFEQAIELVVERRARQLLSDESSESEPDDAPPVVLVAGSLYLVADVYRYFARRGLPDDRS